jgi:transcriptional regulator with PAS, ATPase and Fis domain
MNGESLNIESHILPMILKALNSSCCTKNAAKKLGITTRTLYRKKIQYDITREGKNKSYIIKPTKMIVL